MKNSNRVRFICTLLAVAVLVCGTLTGCGRQVKTDEAGGIASDMGAENSRNLMNPTQLPDSSFIYDASIADLENADSYMEGQTVQVTGEVVGDCIADDLQPDYCWITLQANDGSYSEVNVFMPRSLARVIDTYGVYGKRGTTLQVRGTFTMACTQHTGLTGIHADHVALVGRGAISESQFNPSHFVPGLALIVIGAALTVIYRYLSERRR
ncbi:hydrolase [Adlercreutzia sp. ZJ154]|uniref:hydrolase n=1 Tax=Adlercreutzia sp. ZJ154 TaxID=2709790 RepID=UPI0013EB15E1|nr:hydrolase [Adlercreutzia sp. ZJ154]